MKKLLLLLLFIILPLASAIETYVEQDGLSIETPQEVFYCEPIYRHGGCLINSELTITNTNNIPKDVKLLFSTNKNVEIRDQFIHKDGSRIRKGFNKRHGSNFDTTSYRLTRDTSITIELQFYIKESGKFDYGIAYDGIELWLDPFFNVTHNSSSPSYHLLDGIVDLDNDNIFSKINITNELSDENDSTTFPTVIHTSNASQTITFLDHDNVDNSNTPDLNQNNESYLNDLNLTSISGIQAIEVCVLTGTFSASPQLNISIAYNTTDAPITLNGFKNAVAQAWVCENVTSENINRFNQLNMHVGVICPNCDGTNKAKIRRDNENAPISQWDGSSWSIDNGHTLMYNTTVSYSEVDNPDGDAISVFFDLEINASNQYWLRTRKTTSGITNATVFSYINDTHLNTTFVTEEINTGWDVISLSSIITNNMTSRFRLYTETNHSFSEIQLIEQLEDNESPNIFDCKINNTNLGCNDFIRLQCNVTDNNQVDNVFHNYTDPSFSTTMADNLLGTDTYFVDIQYTHDTNGTNETFTFIGTSAFDFLNNSNGTVNNLNYNYTCEFPDGADPVITLLNPSNGQVFNTITEPFNVNLSCSGTDDIKLVNMSMYGNFSGIFGVNTTDFMSTTSYQLNNTVSLGFGTYLWTCNGNDNSSNSAFAPSNFTFTINDTDTSPAITLLNPVNESEFNFTFGLEINFSCFVQDELGIVNVTGELIHPVGEGFSTQTNTIIINGSVTELTHNFTFDFSDAHSGDHKWNCKAFDSTDQQAFSLNNTFSGISSPFELFKVTECPTTTSQSFLLAFFLITSFIILIMGLFFSEGLIVMFGAIALVVISLFLFACITMFGYVILFFGIYMIAHSIFFVRGR